jgi:hypothetical protein
LKKECSKGRHQLWSPLEIPEICEDTHLRPYQYMYGRYKFDGVTQRTLSSVANLYMKFSSTSNLFHDLTTTTTTTTNNNNSTSNGYGTRSNVDNSIISSDNVNSRGDDTTLERLNNNNTTLPRSSIYSLIDNPIATSNNSSNTTPAKSPPPSSYNNNSYRGESKSTDIVGRSTDIGIFSPLGAYEEDGDDDDDNDDNDDDDEFDMSKMTTSEEASMFRGIDRLKIIYDILISKTDHCCKLDIRKLLKHKCIVAFMPMHDLVDVYNLQLNWLTFFTPPWKQPNTLIRNYFGKYII